MKSPKQQKLFVDGRIRVRTLNYGSGSKRPKNIGFGSGTLVGEDWWEKMSLSLNLPYLLSRKYRAFTH
jgi:hypothetical protein